MIVKYHALSDTEDEEMAEEDDDDDDEPINPLVDALFDEVERLRMQVRHNQLKCGQLLMLVSI